MTRTIICFALLVLTTAVHAECYSSAEAVKAVHHDSWPSWEGRSHPGQRCWYATTKEARHVRNANGARMAVSDTQVVAVRVAPVGDPRSSMEAHQSGALESETLTQTKERRHAHTKEVRQLENDLRRSSDRHRRLPSTHDTRPRPASLPAGAVIQSGVMPDNLFSLFSSQVTSDFDWNSAEWDRLFAARERAGLTFAAVGGR